MGKIVDFLISLFKKESQTDIKVDLNSSNDSNKTRTYLYYNWNPVIEFETGGRYYYEKFLKHMTWPEGESGITMGIGADLGYMSQEEFDKFFASFFTSEEVFRIKSIIGLKGEKAKEVLPKVKDIELSWENASKAFVSWTLPKFWKMANDIWPKIDELHESAQVALVSLVFNRGNSIKGESRVEMANIKDLVANKDYKGIAREIRSMKRLWRGKTLNGLMERREKEAIMVESCS